VKTQTSTAAVLLDELVMRCNGSREAVDTWLRKFRVTPTTDWAGRATIPAEVAERVMHAYRQAAAEAAEAQSAYDHYLKDRERRFLEASDNAYRQTAERELELQYSTNFTGGDGRGWAEGGVTYTNDLTLWPHGRQKAREAALEARAEFDKREPRLSFDDWMKRRTR
jgi:hypothetical protein